MSFIVSTGDDKISTDQLSIHLQAIVLPEKRSLQSTLWKGQTIKAALTNYLSICKPLYYLKKGTRNLPFSSAYRRSFLTFAFCWLKLFQYHKCLFGIVFQLTLHY